jgi:SAM-dependent methyltransferase
MGSLGVLFRDCLRLTGVPRVLRRVRAFGRFIAAFRAFRAMQAGSGMHGEVRWKDRYPCLEDQTASTQYPIDYVYHTAWGARVLAATHPARHVDISSFLYFGVIVSAFVPVEFYDFRPAHIVLDGYRAARADLMRLPFADKSIESLSCMHVVEHVGLGRYGDDLDPEGDQKAVRELGRVLAPGGNLLLVVPMGRPRIEFNAHRIYSAAMAAELWNGLELVEFALIPDPPAHNGMVRDAALAEADLQDHGCGCFWLRKPAAGA